MNNDLLYLMIADIILLVPFLFIIFRREYLNHKYETSKKQASLLGFLISINGAIRTGKTSFQSGISHIFQLEIEEKLNNIIEETMIIYKNIDFSIINKVLNDYFKDRNDPDFEYIYQKIKELLNLNNLQKSLIFNFISSKKSIEKLQDYIFAYWVLNYRKNYVQSKTSYYSHITSSFNYEYKIEQQKIHVAYEQEEYSIYDFMIELIDEASDEIGANKRYEDVKEESGDKDYRRKFGQIHQERNRMITTKQDVKDEIKRFRTLTQSNIWLPKKIAVVGQYTFIIELIEFLAKTSLVLYKFVRVFIPYIILKFIKQDLREKTYEEYSKQYFETINVERKVLNKLLHIKWFFKSIAYNKYVTWNYHSEDDVKKRDPIYYDKFNFYIPTQFCFGTYDTHFYRMIQNELLAASNSKSTEINWFNIPGYFEDENMIGGDIDDINF